MPSNEVILADAIKTNTTSNLTQYMLNGKVSYDVAMEYFGKADIVELHRTKFSAKIHGQTFELTYDFWYLKPIMKAMGASIKELKIAECPCEYYIVSILYRVVDGATNLRKVTFDENLPEKYEQWIRRHTNAKLIFPSNKPMHSVYYVKAMNHGGYLYKIAQLGKSTPKKLVIDPVDFLSLLLPFTDRGSFRAISTLIIHGNFKEADLTPENITKFVKFINGFPNLKCIEAYFTFPHEGNNGFKFYPVMKKLERESFLTLLPNLRGTIRFRGSVSNFDDMTCGMVRDIKDLGSKLRDPIIYDRKNSIIQRKIKINEILIAEFSIEATFCQLHF